MQTQGEQVRVIWSIGTTDVVYTAEVKSNTPEMSYSYGDSTDVYNSINPTYNGQDGNTYTRLYGSTTGAADVYIRNSDGYLTTTAP